MVEEEKFKNLTKEWEVREKYIAFDKVKVCVVAFQKVKGWYWMNGCLVVIIGEVRRAAKK